MEKNIPYSRKGQVTLESMGQATWYNNWTINIFKSYLRGTILEVGCGIGNFTKMLIPYGKIYALDIDKTCIAKTKQKVKNSANIGFGDIENGLYFFKNKRFDTIVCINVLEHIENDKKALSNMNKLLKRAGTLILLVPSHPILFGEIDRAIGHYRRYTENRIKIDLKRLRLKVVFAKKINFLGAIGWFISGKVLKEVSVNGKKLKLFDRIAPFILPWEEKIEPPLGTSILVIAKKLHD